jgi:uncharacterized membrane protein YhaH (DUF805 family)
MKLDASTYRLTEKGNFGRIALIIAVIGIVLCIVAYTSDHKHFYHAYLTAFGFWLSIALGALFFVMLQHLTNAKWSVVVRRLAESMSATLPWMFLLFIPVYLGLHAAAKVEISEHRILHGPSGHLLCDLVGAIICSASHIAEAG